jgi:hypothetical protein
MFGADFTPFAILHKLEFVGGVGFIFFRKIILGATFTTK